MKLENKFNDLNGKDWIKFLKSWYPDMGTKDLYQKNISFFTKASNEQTNLQYLGHDRGLIDEISKTNALSLNAEGETHFGLWDLRDRWKNIESYDAEKEKLIHKAKELFNHLADNRFLCVLINPIESQELYHPTPWDFAKNLARIFSLKDEKIGWHKGSNKCYYALYFRKDSKSKNESTVIELDCLSSYSTSHKSLEKGIVVKPKPRNNLEIHHPAKFPEELVSKFISEYSKPKDNIFDPMCGSGSTLLSAVKQDRNGFGVELSPIYAEISNQRIDAAAASKPSNFKVINNDIRDVDLTELPKMDYIITSPPYWNMLHAKGGKGQAMRMAKGLPTIYSDSPKDLGNIDDYNDFLTQLSFSYDNVGRFLKPGAYMTIIVKNLKKKGKNYPLAWDLSEMLVQQGWEMKPERFWFQDNVSLFPYGYYKTYVSNIVHHYCLTLRKPESFN